MDEALRELQTAKFWILALVGILLSILANFATDWLKEALRRGAYLIPTDTLGTKSLKHEMRDVALPIAISVSALALLAGGYYWTPRIAAAIIGIFRAKAVLRLLDKELDRNFPNRQPLIRNEAIVAVLTVWIQLVGLPGIIYELVQMENLSLNQGFLGIAAIYAAYASTNSFRRSRNAA